MSSYKHKSGAQKRQERQQRVNEEHKGSRRLFDVGVFEGSADPDSQVPLELPQKAKDVGSTDDDSKLSVDGDAASSH